MSYRIAPVWWPLMGLASPVLLPFLFLKNRRFRNNLRSARKDNDRCLANAIPLDLPELDRFEITVLVEQMAEPGFLKAPGVSYLIRTDRGTLLFDVGYGPDHPSLVHNATRLGVQMDEVDALAISHLHPDHMGGFAAARAKQVRLPDEMATGKEPICYLPDTAGMTGGRAEIVNGARMLAAGVASTGPLARSLFLMGYTKEQALVAHVKGKGLVILTGCGHPTIETIVQMVRRVSDVPIHAICGGLHFPVTDSPFRKPGLKVQMIWGTGKPPWKRITDEDLTATIENLNTIAPERMLLSAHDTCDHALGRMAEELQAETDLLKAGATYSFCLP